MDRRRFAHWTATPPASALTASGCLVGGAHGQRRQQVAEVRELVTDPANLKAIARHADDLGFESFYVPEHVTLYPGARVGEIEFTPDLPIADPLECLAFVAASTTTILFGTGVLLLPSHHPVGLAKRLATIDVLSSGRMRLLTIGVSSLPGEAAAVGVDYATRGRGLRRPGRRPPHRRHDLDRPERATPPARGLRHLSRPATLSDAAARRSRATQPTGSGLTYPALDRERRADASQMTPVASARWPTLPRVPAERTVSGRT